MIPDCKFHFKALKKLPTNYVDDKTRVTGASEGAVIAINPELPAIVFYEGADQWRELELRAGPFNPKPVEEKL